MFVIGLESEGGVGSGRYHSWDFVHGTEDGWWYACARQIGGGAGNWNRGGGGSGRGAGNEKRYAGRWGKTKAAALGQYVEDPTKALERTSLTMGRDTRHLPT